MNKRKKTPHVELGEVWWYYVGINVGNEIGKGYDANKGLKGSFKRTAIILKELPNRLILIAPITTKENWFAQTNGIKLLNY